MSIPSFIDSLYVFIMGTHGENPFFIKIMVRKLGSAVRGCSPKSEWG